MGRRKFSVMYPQTLENTPSTASDTVFQAFWAAVCTPSQMVEKASDKPVKRAVMPAHAAENTPWMPPPASFQAFCAAVCTPDHTLLKISPSDPMDPLFALPAMKKKVNSPFKSLNWGDKPQQLEAKPIQDTEGNRFLFLDLNTAKEIKGGVSGVFMVPNCLR